MRISNHMQARFALDDINKAKEDYVKAQTELASGMRVRAVSHDPVAAGAYLRAQQGIAAADQYSRNIVSARSRLELEESVVNQVSDFLSNAKSIAIVESSGSRNAQTRLMNKEQVDFMLQQVISLGNTKSGTDYVFAGQRVRSPAFDSAGNYLGDTNEVQVEIDKGVMISPARTGERFLVNSGAINALKSLSQALANNDTDAIAQAQDMLGDSYSSLQEYLADVGGRTQKINASDNLLTQRKDFLTLQSSSLVDSDMPDTMTRLLARQNMFEAAIVATKKAMDLSLASQF